MPIVEASIAVGYLAAWAARKTRPVGAKLDHLTDDVVDAQVNRLDRVIRAKLVEGDAQTDLTALSSPELATRDDIGATTVTSRLTDKLNDAMLRDTNFEQLILEIVQAIRAAEKQSNTTFTATASGNGRIYQAINQTNFDANSG